MNNERRTGTLDVRGARLFYEARGRGPVLLISDSGGGEVDRFEPFAAALADDFTVVTYDRRGFARSPADDPAEPVSFTRHAQDAHRLLAALTTAPAGVVSMGLGVANALLLARQDPSRVGLLIAHEPLLPALVGGVAGAHFDQELAELERLYARDGLAAAVVRISGLLGAQRGDQRNVENSLASDRAADTARRPAAEPPRRGPGQRTANFDVILRNEIPAARALTVDVTAIRDAGVRIVAATGATSAAALLGPSSARGLAATLGDALVAFSGGHNPHITHPAETAAEVRAIAAPALGDVSAHR